MSFEDLKLSAPLLRAVESNRFEQPTEIQQRAIPAILSGRDLMASAQTGTGKTAAFVLPILERLTANHPRAGRGPRVLVLAPTRELAAQVTDDVRKLSRFCPLKFGTIVGGVAYPPQHRLLAQGGPDVRPGLCRCCQDDCRRDSERASDAALFRHTGR
jgi:ATP-dependent RNA helicase RhlE